MPRAENQLRGWDRGWKYFCERFGQLHRDDPSYIAVTRYAVGMLSATVASGGKEEGGGARPAPRRQSKGNHGTTKIATGHDQPPGGVLFVPNVASSYCLGSCIKLARACRDLSPEMPIWFLQSFDYAGEWPAATGVVSWRSLRLKLGPRSVLGLPENWKWSRRYLELMASSPEIVASAEVVFGKAWRRHFALWLLRYRVESEIAAAWLKRHGIRMVVTVNDTVKPAAPFVSACLNLPVATALIQHGTPALQNVPFVAKEYWSWGKTSSDMLASFGADRGLIDEVGNLEVAGAGEPNDGASPQSQGGRALLLILQWVGAAQWGEAFYRDIVWITAGVLAEADVEWTLRIRLHPHDPESVKDEIDAELGAGELPYGFTPAGISPQDDIAAADAVLTINSSAIAHAIALGRPYRLFLPQRIEDRVGKPFVAIRSVARNAEDLGAWLSEVAAGELPSEAEIESVLANRGSAMEVAARKICARLAG